MTSFNKIAQWAKEHPFEPVHVDCATAVMLKILDGKCKMNQQEKQVMSHLYHAVKHQPGLKTSDEMHTLIAKAKSNLDDEMQNHIYEKRVLAETMISRPVMKSFKAMIRQQRLFAPAKALNTTREETPAYASP